jgi:spore coat protein U-like protein
MKYSKIFKTALATAVVGFLALSLASTPAFATTTVTSTFTVSATVSTSCSISGTTIAFGSYTGGVLNQTGTLTITCNTASVGYNIGLNPGLATGATVSTRKMQNGAALLNYGLYQDSGYGTNWGQTVGTDTKTGTSSATAMTQTTQTIYGQIPAGQVVTPGSYSDTITVSIIY